MANGLSVLGGMSAQQFLDEYWQKKPLLVRQALPEIIGLFEPQDIKELALDPEVTARLVSQHGSHHQQWKVKRSPLSIKDFKQLPPYWTLLVQAVDHYSLELQSLWKAFDFIPQWRREDIMISYAPQGGSVGQHFDFYDVFLLQGYGHRRWQLGQQCNNQTPIQPQQPLQLLTDFQANFDEILAPGDLLYVPPYLAHYGVAQDECLTLSFGFRMPNHADILDRMNDHWVAQSAFQQPIQDRNRQCASASGLVTQSEIDSFKQQLIDQLTQDTSFDDVFAHTLMALSSEPKYLDHVPEPESLTVNELMDRCSQGWMLQVEPASRLLYRHIKSRCSDHDHSDRAESSGQMLPLEFWANGERLSLHSNSLTIFKALADGESIMLSSQCAQDSAMLHDLLNAMNQAIIWCYEHEAID